MSGIPPHDEPADVSAERGQVIMEAGGVILALTPEAAEVTADRLYDCTAKARGQRRYGESGPLEGD